MKSILALLLGLTNYAQSGGGSWDYDHMDHWQYDYEMCGTNDQSPINIQSTSAVYDTSVCGKALNWTVNFNQHHFKISNNGHSLAVQPVARIGYDPDAEIEETVIDELGRQYTTLSTNENVIGRLQNQFKPAGSAHSEFCLHSFHFHWGLENEEGSEHLIDDKSYPLEVHFVHYSCEHANIGSTLGQFGSANQVNTAEANGEDTHQLAVVGIMFDVKNYDNPAFEQILNYDHMEDILLPSSSVNIINGLYLQDIIPDGVFTDGYYAYEGSLTTPPCTNIVRWHVMNARSYIGRAQMERFRALMATPNITSAPNFREVQENVKTVYACMDVEGAEDASDGEEKKANLVWLWICIAIVIVAIFGAIMYYRGKKAVEERRGRARSASNASVSYADRRTDHQ